MAHAVLEICDHTERSNSRGGSPPVCVTVVLATFQEVLVPVVIGLLIKDPCTIHHYTGMELAELQGVVNRWAVHNALCCLASKILFVIESDLPGLSIYLEQITKNLKTIQLWIVYGCKSLVLLFNLGSNQPVVFLTVL